MYIKWHCYHYNTPPHLTYKFIAIPTPTAIPVAIIPASIALPTPEHTWFKDKNNWGYVQFKDSKEVTDEYIKYTEELKTLSLQGYSAAVYTQTTDVEGEINGIMTYDRKVIKMDEERIRKANQEVIKILGEPF